MADHGEIQYATAAGNDLAAHEAGYEQFLQGTFVGTFAVISILLGLTIGGVLGHWLSAALILIATIVATAIAAWSGSRTVIVAMTVISAAALLLNAYS
jgi:Bacterial aa3 type cytochrome c oxidase subunit IV